MIGIQQYQKTHLKVLDEIKDIINGFPPLAQERCLKLLDYCFRGKHLRGILVFSSFLEITKINPDSEDAYIGYVIADLLEMVHSAFLIADDFMDKSQLRHGKQCWYLCENVGSTSINDTVILENIAFTLLIRHYGKELSDELFYTIFTYLRQTYMITAMGQSLDGLTPNTDFETYNLIVYSKTTFYSFISPIIVGCVLSQKFTVNQIESLLKDILIRLGFLFQAHDDFLDVYGDPNLTGKIGSDIEDSKLTWFKSKAFELASPEQQKILKESFGHHETVQKVKDIYDELNLKQIFLEFSENETNAINKLISDLPDEIPKETLKSICKILYNRRN